MISLSVSGKDYKISEFEKLQLFLKNQGIDFGKFDVNPKSRSILKEDSPSQESRDLLINLHNQYKSAYSDKNSFRCDVVCFYPEFEHQDYIINKFGSIHYHYETEFWYFVDGEAEFGFLGKYGLKFEIIVSSGFFLQVPEGIWQWFKLTDKKKMKAIRFFYTDDVEKTENQKRMCDALI